MKTMLSALIVLAGLTSTAYADIQCGTDLANKMSIYIKSGQPTKSSFYQEVIPVQVTIQGLRLYYTLPATMVKANHYTRLDVGLSYAIDLGKNFSISLKDINYAPPGYEHMLGFYGVYTEGLTKKSTKLKCKYV